MGIIISKPQEGTYLLLDDRAGTQLHGLYDLLLLWLQKTLPNGQPQMAFLWVSSEALILDLFEYLAQVVEMILPGERVTDNIVQAGCLTMSIKHWRTQYCQCPPRWC